MKNVNKQSNHDTKHTSFLGVRKKTEKLEDQKGMQKDQLLETEKVFQENNTRNFCKTFKTKLRLSTTESLI